MSRTVSASERLPQQRTEAEILTLGSELLRAAFTTSAIASGESNVLLAEVIELRIGVVTLGTDAAPK
jgi:hypothetical protein